MAPKYTPKNKFPKMTLDQPAAIVVLKSVGKESDRKIAQRFNCDPKTVRNVFQKWGKTGKVASVKQTGRKRFLNDSQRNDLKNACMQLPFKNARFFRDHEKLNLKHVSVDTVKRELRRTNLCAYVARNKDHLLPCHTVARVNFAEKHKEFDWKRVVFSDEKILQNHCNAKQYVRRPYGQAYQNKYVVRMNKTKRFKVNMWGFINSNGCGLVHIKGEKEGPHKGKHTSKTYLQILKDIKIEELADKKKRILFMQDNASVHTADIVKLYLFPKVDVLDWPSLSPDLNPIENVWALMQRKFMKECDSEVV